MRIGITERGDAALSVNTWLSKLDKVDCAILITKNCSNRKFQKALLENRKKLILHATCTFLGGSIIEPNVPKAKEIFYALNWLIENGFPSKQIVLRIDPLLGYRQILQFSNHIESFINIGIKRFRFSFCDFYPHVKRRFEKTGVNLPVLANDGFNLSFSDREDCLNKFSNLVEKYKISIESCGEFIDHEKFPLISVVGCVSKKDLQILKIKEFPSVSYFKQRKFCLCLPKVELLEVCGRCSHECLYCYWKDFE